MKRYFLGYDPGLNSAAALVELDGSVAGVKSWREGKESEVFSWIAGYGKPLFIASDKVPIPRAVKRIAGKYGVKSIGFALSVEEKTRLAKCATVKNSHERDALSAAIACYKEHKNKIEKTRKKGKNEDKIARVLSGERTVPWPEKKKNPEKRKSTDLKGMLERTKKIEDARQELKKKVEELEKELEKRWVRRIDRRLERALKKEKREKNKIKKQYKILLKGLKPLKEQGEEIFEKDHVLAGYVDKKEAERLAEKRIGLVIHKRITKQAEELLDAQGVEHFPVEMVGLKEIDGILVMEKVKKRSFEGVEWMIREYREKRT